MVLISKAPALVFGPFWSRRGGGSALLPPGLREGGLHRLWTVWGGSKTKRSFLEKPCETLRCNMLSLCALQFACTPYIKT